MADIPRSVRQALRYTAITAVVLTAVGVALTLGPGAGWVLRYVDGVHGLKGAPLENALDAVRGRALALGTGLAALVAVYYTARNADTARRTFQLSEQGQVTERYTKAIEQLGSEKLDIRLGGIYALERIATDSARDHSTVMEVLAAFIREHTTTPKDSPNPPNIPSNNITPLAPQVSGPAADIQAAATVIGRRITSQDTRKIDLTFANLSNADLNYADLTEALLNYADLTEAFLPSANLSRASLDGAKLNGAELVAANLSRASLNGAKLNGACLMGADLSGANLSRVDLSRVDLTKVRFDEETVWPEGFDPRTV